VLIPAAWLAIAAIKSRGTPRPANGRA